MVNYKLVKNFGVKPIKIRKADLTMTYNKKSIEDVVINAGTKVFVRCDFNVPSKDGVITSDKRIVEALPTIKYLMDIYSLSPFR